MAEENPKIDMMCQTLLRKQLVTNENRLTTEGKELLAFFDLPSKEKITRIERDKDGFEKWWNTYPGTDTFKHKGVSFSGTRALRINKEECQIKFNKIILEGEHTSDMLIKALEFDVLQKKENSIKNKTNKLTYMQNSFTYLNQRTFEPFIDLIKEGETIKESPTQHSVDI